MRLRGREEMCVISETRHRPSKVAPVMVHVAAVELSHFPYLPYPPYCLTMLTSTKSPLETQLLALHFHYSMSIRQSPASAAPTSLQLSTPCDRSYRRVLCLRRNDSRNLIGRPSPPLQCHYDTFPRCSHEIPHQALHGTPQDDQVTTAGPGEYISIPHGRGSPFLKTDDGRSVCRHTILSLATYS